MAARARRRRAGCSKRARAPAAYIAAHNAACDGRLSYGAPLMAWRQVPGGVASHLWSRGHVVRPHGRGTWSGGAVPSAATASAAAARAAARRSCLRSASRALSSGIAAKRSRVVRAPEECPEKPGARDPAAKTRYHCWYHAKREVIPAPRVIPALVGISRSTTLPCRSSCRRCEGGLPVRRKGAAADKTVSEDWG